MPILQAELQVAGAQARCDGVPFSFHQSTDRVGRPNSGVRPGRLVVRLTGDAASWPIWPAIKADSFRRVSGYVLFYDGQQQVAKRYTFYDACLSFLETTLDARGWGNEAALQTELHFAATVEIDGLRFEAFSTTP